ncbi:hypothetical protein [Marinitenerispora sediminis]|uniref:Uncharacterized protein n=1 Tax=Marinitenerispora sediminis TaxID=1931232 RepID=A0A368T2X0_9ACTN|nr:hypothetical protein [Marinitenerispora sediminis]RCV50250.1 hypothetical protein DEF23_22385 [Marinitenerispora sediminis]RCV56313.1 hypothetical protein DEF24_16835 [Marinitenerispora sediminis]RCV56505.1 hypothetical protein DEF28_03285 [Marinitenerispora sediminis]
MSHEPVPRDEVAAALKAGRELGPEYDDAVASSLAERLDQTIDARIAARLAAAGVQEGNQPPARRGGMSRNTLRFVMGIISLTLAIPITAIGASAAGAIGMLAGLFGVIAVYLMVVLGADR